MKTLTIFLAASHRTPTRGFRDETGQLHIGIPFHKDSRPLTKDEFVFYTVPDEPEITNGKLYHLVAINNKTNQSTQLTGYPMSHAKCCVNKSKFTPHPGRRIDLAEV